MLDRDRWSANMQFQLTNSQSYRYLVLGLVGIALPLRVTIRVSRVSTMVSVGVIVN